jgi:hypothetical protein
VGGHEQPVRLGTPLRGARPSQTNGAQVSGLGQVGYVTGPRVYYSQDTVILRMNESEMATIGE